MLRVVLFLFPHSGHGTTFSQFKMHVSRTIRSRRLLFHPNHVGYNTPCNTILCDNDLDVALSSETRCTVLFQNESNGGRVVVFDVARPVQ